jgi:hypothetical protein
VVASITGTKASGQRARDTDRITLTCCVPEDSDPPVASAGPDQSVNSGGMVTLDGRASFDPDGDALTYEWEQVEGPPVVLSDDSSPTPSFRAPAAVSSDVVLRFALTVNDGIWSSFPDEVIVRVLAHPDTPPTACATYMPLEPRSNDLVTLDGTCSTDLEGPVTCAWMQSDGPAVTLSNPTSCVTTFAAPLVAVPTNLVFRLTVTDNGAPPNSDTLDLTVPVRPPNQSPVAVAGDDRRVCENAAVRLDGSGSFDPDPGDTFVCAWTQTLGIRVALSGADTCVAGFLAPQIAGMSEALTFNLTVTDNHGASGSDEVVITVVGDPTDPACVQTVSVTGVSVVPSFRATGRPTR